MPEHKGVHSLPSSMALTAKLNRLTYDDADKIRDLFSELIGKKVDESFLLIPPFYTTGGDEIRIGRNVFVNQNCTFYDLGGLDIADDVMIGPNVSIITSGHPLEPSQRRTTIGTPIVIEKNVWIAAGAIIIGGVTVGENSVVAAGIAVEPRTSHAWNRYVFPTPAGTTTSPNAFDNAFTARQPVQCAAAMVVRLNA
jgi:acetyltransferase-like isoleucine patch superfamily enzyme